MADGTRISWTDASWPVTAGCEVASTGCKSCYAATLTSTRLRHLPLYSGLAVDGQFTGEVRLADDARLAQPLGWRKPRRVFVASMSDLFHPRVPIDHIAHVFAVMSMARQHTFQVLTKRHARMRALLSGPALPALVTRKLLDHPMFTGRGRPAWPVPDGGLPWPLPNVWVGVSAENQEWADRRIPHLLDTPAAVRWVSIEPMLEHLHLGKHLRLEPLFTGSHISFTGLDWVVAGGESGRTPRRAEWHWFRSLHEQCRDAGVAFHMKQTGDALARSLGLADRSGRNPGEWPDPLPQQYPDEAA